MSATMTSLQQITNLTTDAIFDHILLLKMTLNLSYVGSSNASLGGGGGGDDFMRGRNISASLLRPQRPPSWSRALLEAMRSRYDPWTMTFDSTTLTALVVAFSILIFVGALGNGLVCYVVARRPHMRTPRNIFITNLAVSDLILCLFTQPFNLTKIALTAWPLGTFLCKFVPMMAATNVFVSTMSITAIALDRFQVIVYPTRRDSMRHLGVAMLAAIWGVSLLMASPLFVFNHLEQFPPFGDVVFYQMCVENIRYARLRSAYSILSIILQYAAPIIVVSAAHAGISSKLKRRLVNGPTVTLLQLQKGGRTSNNNNRRRERKTNLLLATIALVFALSWLPLNVTNLAADFGLLEKVKSNADKELLFSMCNLVVLLSACLNALIYGWLNDNFRWEFVSIFSACLPAACTTLLPSRPTDSSYCTSTRADRRQRMVAITSTMAAFPLAIVDKKVIDSIEEKTNVADVDL